ncbi:MAG: glycosyltransferase [Arachnia sp.]
MSPNMVFHTPLPLNPAASAASGIRPLRMRRAFEELGYTVWTVAGYARERAVAMRDVERALARGERFDFCYSESSTMPMTMTDPHHLPLHPLLDRRFFRKLRAAGTPVGHFLRDIFWRFPEYREAVRFPKREAALAAYRFDLATLRRDVDVVFLPSVPMARYLDLGDTRVEALPPGHDDGGPFPGPDDGVRLFYVGGIGAHYRLQGLFEGVATAAAEGVDVSLTVCTRPELWAAEEPTYRRFESPAIRVVHASGAELEEHYRAANVGALFVEPDPYWGFAVPVKLYEYLGAGKPIIAAGGSLTGELVEAGGWGWAPPYDVPALVALLRRLAEDPDERRRAAARVAQDRAAHSWRGRAEQAARALTS